MSRHVCGGDRTFQESVLNSHLQIQGLNPDCHTWAVGPYAGSTILLDSEENFIFYKCMCGVYVYLHVWMHRQVHTCVWRPGVGMESLLSHSQGQGLTAKTIAHQHS